LSNFQHGRAPTGRRIVRLNLDETSICFHQSEKTGFLVADARKRARGGDPLVRNVSQGTQRTNMTHLAVISDDTDVQQFVPQILIVGESVFPQSILAHVLECVLPPWQVVRQKKAWVNVETMMMFGRALVSALRHLQDSTHFIMSFDTYRAHTNPRVLRYLSMNGFHVIIIPSLMTWALQPLDTHAFAVYKREVSTNAAVRALAHDDPPKTWRDLIALVIATGNDRVWSPNLC
jgi:hypothetical protein